MHVELSRDLARSFPEIADPSIVDTLRVWHCKYQTLEPLRQFTNLRGLDVATFPDSSLEVLSKLGMLHFLSILHLPKVTDLAPLGELQSLVTLRLATLPSWDASSKKTIVTSLEPLKRLKRLRYIELLSVVPLDRSLQPLEDLHLEPANFHGFRKAEIVRFFAASQAEKKGVSRPGF